MSRNPQDPEITPTPQVDSDAFADFASGEASPDAPAKRPAPDSDELEIVRPGEEYGATPAPRSDDDEDDGDGEDLLIVRDAVAQLQVEEPSAAVFRAPAPPPPPPSEIEADVEPEPEPEEPLVQVDWEEEFRVGPRLADVAAASATGAKPRARQPRRRKPVAKDAPMPAGPVIASVVGALSFWAATAGTAFKIEPFHTWYYLFAWYPFLFGVNHVAALGSPQHSLFQGRWRTLWKLFAWSVPVWLFFELLNFRLQDWYYVGVPQTWGLRRLGVTLSFATVLPGLFFIEEALRVHGVFGKITTPEFDVSRRFEKRLLIVGAAWAALVLLFPTVFFPLVWGVPVLILEPWLRRRGAGSLLEDLSRGNPTRIVRLLFAGLVCGVFWEGANFLAGGKWIYTVPGLEAIKWFEMPPLGFLGFPPFALSCWCLARALVATGLLPDWEPAPPAPAENVDEPAEDGEAVAHSRTFAGRASGKLIVLTTILASMLVLEGMDRWTVDSHRPQIEDVPGIPDGIADYVSERRRDDLTGLLQAIEAGELSMPGASNERMLDDLEASARLVSLHGLGAKNTARLRSVGVKTIDDLAARHRGELTGELAALNEPGWEPHPRRIGVWIRAAQKDLARR